MSRPLLELSGVSKRFCRRTDRRLRYAVADALREVRGLPPRDELREGESWAIRNVDLRVHAGEVVGVIGQNGAGKSTLMQLAAGMLLPTTGTITAWTREICRIDQAGVISAHETGRENILMQLALHRVPRAETAAEIEAIAAVADLHDRLDDLVGNYSAGMRGRLGFAIYVRLHPRVLLVDEAIGGSDQRFRERFRGFLQDFAADGGSMLFAMHDTNAILSFCHRVVLLDHGSIVMSAEPGVAIDAYNELAGKRGLPPMPKPRRRVRAAGAQRPLEQASAVNPAPLPTLGLSVSVELAEGTACATGTPAEFIVTIDADQPMQRIFCMLEIGRGEISPLSRSTAPLLDLPAGRTRLRCRVASLPFVEGRYDVSVRLFDEGWREEFTHSPSLALRIGDPESLEAPRVALVRLRAAWDAPEVVTGEAVTQAPEEPKAPERSTR